jgi:hypothetical protein
MRRRTPILAGTLAVALLVAGCATTITGSAEGDAAAIAAAQAASSASSASSSESAPSSSDTSAPDTSTDPSTSAPTTDSSTDSSTASSSASAGGTGDYPTTPLTLPATPQTQQEAVLLEARRIGDALTVPTLVDKTLISAVNPTLPLKGPAALGALVFTDPTPTVAQKQGMVTGFVAGRRNSDNTSSAITASFEFPDATKAKAAVKPLADSVKSADFNDKAVAIPGHTGALGWAGKNSEGENRVQVFEAVGAMVVYVYSSDKTVADQRPRTKALLDALDAGFKDFTPTAAADLMKLPNDTDGMEAHTVPNTGDDRSVIDGVYSANGALNFDSDPIATQALYKSAGVDLISFGASNVIRARDDAAATSVRDGYIDETRSADNTWAPVSLPGAPDSASCLQQALKSAYYCVATSGRYAIEVNGQSAEQAVQLLNAQTAMLQGF